MKRSLKWLTFAMAVVMLFMAAGCNSSTPVASEATPAPEGTTPEPAGEATPEATATPNPLAALDFWNTNLDKDMYYICLIGSDEESPEMYGSVYGHNDTTMILQLDVKNKTMKLASFMRDMYVNIPGQGKYRLNNAYFRGGPELVKRTIKDVFDIEIDYYAKVTFTTFEQIMTIVGPIVMDIQATEIEHINKLESAVSMDNEPMVGHGAIKEAGKQEVNQYQLMSIARDRHSERVLEDGTRVWSDLGRNDRQREIIRSAWEKVKTKEAVAIPAAAMGAQVYVDTDMELGLIISILKHFMEGGSAIEDKGFPLLHNFWEISVSRKTGEEYTKSDLEALYEKEKAEYEAEAAAGDGSDDGSTGDGSETGDGTESAPAEEKEPFPDFKTWKDKTGYDSVIGWSPNKNIRELHEFFGIN